MLRALLFFTVFLQFEVLANECEVSLPNSNTEMSSLSTSKCIIIKNVNIQNTSILADPSYQKNAVYNIKITTVNDVTILDQTILPGTFSNITKLDTQQNTEIKVTLIPVSANIEYNFNVIHDENTITGVTSIYVGLHSKKCCNK
jgi:hypothetical protein